MHASVKGEEVAEEKMASNKCAKSLRKGERERDANLPDRMMTLADDDDLVTWWFVWCSTKGGLAVNHCITTPKSTPFVTSKREISWITSTTSTTAGSAAAAAAI